MAKLSSEKRKNSLFPKKKSFVGLTPGRIYFEICPNLLHSQKKYYSKSCNNKLAMFLKWIAYIF